MKINDYFNNGGNVFALYLSSYNKKYDEYDINTDYLNLSDFSRTNIPILESGTSTVTKAIFRHINS